jgi:CheY-like chemotaxis protein
MEELRTKSRCQNMSTHSEPVILLAEDSEDDVFILRRAFRQAGVTTAIHVVSDGAEALAYLKGEGKYSRRSEFPLPDLFLLDLKMPHLSGFQVLTWIRQQPELAPLRVVVLTTSDEIRDVNEAYRLGANSFLVKPLEFRDFKDTIQAMYNFWFNVSRAPETSRPPLVNPMYLDKDQLPPSS